MVGVIKEKALNGMNTGALMVRLVRYMEMILYMNHLKTFIVIGTKNNI